jgi:NAD(P)-dependent dehydrogenase (short-subunit alcohol dehydrogenase family)
MNGETRAILITGAASGIGLATRRRFEAKGWRVIGVDLREGEIRADLGTVAGRSHMVEQAGVLAPGGLDAVVACAGISHPGAATLAVNYFGAVATLEGLRPLLLQSANPRAVLVASSVSIYPGDETIIEACLAGDEPRALALVEDGNHGIYVTSKRAVARWMRRAAISPEWGGAGILLNGVGPGVVETPMNVPILKDAAMRAIVAQSNPQVPDGLIPADEIAETIEFLATFGGRFLIGQIVFDDGGTDAIKRADLY